MPTEPVTSQTPERNTRQREAIRNAIVHAKRPLSTQEILEAANKLVSGVGIATVYRNIKAFLQTGDIIVVSLPGDAPRYELAGHGHHHHFHCNRCNRVFDIHHCPGDLNTIAPPGFRVEHHELTLYGLCQSCQ